MSPRVHAPLWLQAPVSIDHKHKPPCYNPAQSCQGNSLCSARPTINNGDTNERKNGFKKKLSSALLAVSDNPLVILLIVNLILLVLGTFMDMSPLIIITTPVFLPVMTGIGMDPVQFGIMLILNLGLGLVTPPVGSVLFVGCAIGGIRIEDTLRSIWPFYLAFLAVLALVTYLPGTTLLLPGYLR